MSTTVYVTPIGDTLTEYQLDSGDVIVARITKDGDDYVADMLIPYGASARFSTLYAAHGWAYGEYHRS